MSLRPVASLGVKLLGLYAMLQSLNSLALAWDPLLRVLNNWASYSYTGPSLTWGDVVPGLITGVLQLSVGVGLWLCCDLLANLIVKNDSPFPVPAATVRATGWRILGLFLLIDGASQIVGLLVRPNAGWPHIFPTPLLVSGVVRVSAGLCLWLVPRLVRGVLDFRNWGRDPETR